MDAPLDRLALVASGLAHRQERREAEAVTDNRLALVVQGAGTPQTCQARFSPQRLFPFATPQPGQQPGWGGTVPRVEGWEGWEGGGGGEAGMAKEIAELEQLLEMRNQGSDTCTRAPKHPHAAFDTPQSDMDEVFFLVGAHARRRASGR